MALLAHPVAVHLLAGLIACSVWVALRRREPWRRPVAALIAWHGPPLLAAGAFYLFHLRQLAVAGGPAWSWPTILQGLASATLGLPAATPPGLAVAILATAWLAVVLVLARRRMDLALLVAVGSLISPVALHLIRPLQTMFERYLLWSAALLLLGACVALAPLWHRGRAARTVLILASLLFLASHLAHFTQLMRHGRGGYSALLHHIVRHSPDRPTAVGVEFFRDKIMALHLIAAHPELRSIRCLDLTQPAPPIVDWLIVSDDRKTQAPATIVGPLGASYRLHAARLHAPLSGIHWFAYRRQDP